MLVIVAGAPASGKTTLAHRLSNALQIPLICRDPITEAMAEALQPRSLQDMAPITQASFRVFYGLITDHLNRGTGVVCETNFHRGVAEPQLQPVFAHARPVLIHCQVDRELSMRRFIERFERGERHWCYFDGERLAEIQAGRGLEAWDRAEPLDLDVPLLTVDTTDGYAPDIDEIARFARSSISAISTHAPVEPAASDGAGQPDATSASPLHTCPSLGFVDDPASRYSHPTHLHRCFAGVSPIRLSTQQQRELCLTDGFVSCPRLGGAYQARPAPIVAAHVTRAEAWPPLGMRPEPTHPSRSNANIARGIVAGVGFAIGVSLAAVVLLAVLSLDRPDLSQDELSRLAVAATSVRLTTVRDVGRFIPTREVDATDLTPSTAGIQQAAAIGVTAPISAPASVPTTTTPQAQPPTTSPEVRRATIRAPEGFTSAFLRDEPRTSARSLRTLSNGTPVEVIEGTSAGDGFTWAHVRTQDGTTGWMVSTALGG